MHVNCNNNIEFGLLGGVVWGVLVVLTAFKVSGYIVMETIRRRT